MAIGLGYVLGFKFPENFNYPYIAKSVQDFWRRWHISLSSWFRDYVYIPLGGNRTGNVYLHLLIVFFVTGLWHGASWNFVMWGMWHGLFLIIERLLRNSKLKNIKIPYVFTWLYAMVVVIIGWVMFRSENMEYAWEYLKIMFVYKDAELANDIWIFLFKDNLTLIIIAFISATPIYRHIGNQFAKYTTLYYITIFMKPMFLITFLILAISYIVNSTYNPFLYFNF